MPQTGKAIVQRFCSIGIYGGQYMDKKVLKKFLFVLSVLFTVLTFLGTVYVLLNKGQVSAGYATVPMLWAVLFITIYNRVKKDLESE